MAMECMLIRCADSKKVTCESDATYCVCRGDLSSVLAKKKMNRSCIVGRLALVKNLTISLEGLRCKDAT